MAIADMACLLCGATALVHASVSAEIELRCGVCGVYTVTVGALNTLRQSPSKAALIRAEIERRRVNGNAKPCVDMDLIDAVLTP
jgi:hypothetical protein